MGASLPRNIGSHLLCQATAQSGICQIQGNLPQTQTGTGTVTSAAIDRQLPGGGFNCDSGVLKQSFAAPTGSPSATSLVTTLLSCATSGGSYSAYTQPSGTAASITDTTGAAGAHFQNLDLSGAQRYLKTQTVVTLTGGSTPAIIFSDEIVLGGLAVETGLPTIA